jgi:hypothetical protein
LKKERILKKKEHLIKYLPEGKVQADNFFKVQAK